MIIYAHGLEFDCDVEFEPAETDVGYMFDSVIINKIVLNGSDISEIISEDFYSELEESALNKIQGGDRD